MHSRYIAGNGDSEHLKCYQFSKILETIFLWCWQIMREDSTLGLGWLKGSSIVIHLKAFPISWVSRIDSKVMIILWNSWVCFSFWNIISTFLILICPILNWFIHSQINNFPRKILIEDIYISVCWHSSLTSFNYSFHMPFYS